MNTASSAQTPPPHGAPPRLRSFHLHRAAHLGMCFGVRRALALAHHHPGPLTLLGDLVHNEVVLDRLRARGLTIAQHPAEVTTREVMITAHGASQRTMDALRQRGLEVLDGACPLVRHVHKTLAGLVARGCHPVIIGQARHVEVRGLTEDHPDSDVILSDEDVARVQPRPRFGVVAQTTQPAGRVWELMEQLRQRFPQSEVQAVDTVCRPTRQRQDAAIEAALHADVMVVVGGARSNNTRELAATCRHFCPRVHQVQTADDLRPEWFADADQVGLTAGTSTPDDTIADIECWLQSLADSIHPLNPPIHLFPSCCHETCLAESAG